MRLANRESIKSKRGLNGVLLSLETGTGQAKLSYLVALYVTPWRIHTIEATGPANLLDADRQKLRTAILSLR